MSEEDISAKASRLAASMAYFLNLTALLASPRIAAKVNQMSTREHLLEHVDGFIELLTVGDESSVRTGGKAVDLRSLGAVRK